MRLAAFLALAGLLFAVPSYADVGWDGYAATIAEGSPLVVAHLKELRSEAKKIKKRSYREQALEILSQPRFSVVEGRRSAESLIVAELKSRGLLDPSVTSIFPSHPPMKFIAAPASYWTVHHSYPGGLVYHTLTNLRIGLAIAEQWNHVYHTTIDTDAIRLAAIWHDSAKAMTVAWNRDGTASPSEGANLAGVAAHHIWGVAEAIYRGMDPDFVVILASAHAAPHPPEKLRLLGYLRAGALIAGKPFTAAGLTEDGNDLAKPPRLQDFLHYLSDHDFIATEVTMATLRAELSKLMLTPTGIPDYWKEDRLLSRYGDLYVYQQFIREGDAGLKTLITKLPKSGQLKY